MLSALDLGWIAGIVEGEGCFAYAYGSAEDRRAGARTGSVVLAVSMTDLDVMQRLGSLMGAPRLYDVKPRPGCKPQYRVAFSGYVAVQWAFTLYPLLGSRRRAKIRELIALWKTQRGHSRDRKECPRGHPLSGPNLLMLRRRNGTQARQCRQCEFVRQAKERARNRPVKRARDNARYWSRKHATAREMGQRMLF